MPSPIRTDRASRAAFTAVAVHAGLAAGLAAAPAHAEAGTARLPRFAITMALSGSSVTAGTTVTATGRVASSAAAHRRIYLQRWGGKHWVTVAHGRVGAKGRYSLSTRVTASQTLLVKMRRDPGHQRAGASARAGVHVTPTGTGSGGNVPAMAGYRSVSPDYTTCVVRANHSLWCLGDNGQGQLGNGTTTDSTVPVQVAGSWSTVSTSQYTECATKTAGTLWCWGEGGYGELGNGSSADSTTPVQVGSASDWAQVTVSATSACGLRGGGTAYCWGYNSAGEIGNGTTTQTSSPVAVSGGLGFASVANTDAQTCGVTTTGAGYCWGLNSQGQLGDGSVTNRTSPVLVSGSHTWASIAVGYSHTCGVTTAGVAYCWGDNGVGALGDGTTTDHSVPTPVSMTSLPGVTWASIGAEQPTSCGLATTGAVYCWGGNGGGYRGDGTTTPRTSPSVSSPVTGGHTWASLVLGNETACGVTTGNTLYCWGDNSSSVLGGNVTGAFSSTPVTVPGL